MSPEDVPQMAVAVREAAQIRGAMELAKRFRRDEDQAFALVLRSCQRFSFAERAAYGFKRGGTTISGPSVKLAREIARIWGNIRYSPVQILGLDDEWVHIRSEAWDLETGAMVFAEDKFRALVQRKVDGKAQWVKADERDLRELVNRRGAILVRNCLLQLFPPDLVDAALAKAQDTMERQAQGDLEKNPDEVRRAIVAAFLGFGVTKQDLVTFLGHPLEQMSAKEVASLRATFKAIQDGEQQAWEVFAKPEPSGGDELREKVAAAQKKADEADQRPEAERVAAQPAVDYDRMTKAQLAGVVSALEEKAGVEVVKLVRDSVGIEDPAKAPKEALVAYAKALADAAGKQEGMF